MKIPKKRTNGRYSYADYCTWPDEGRWELIDGEVFAMSPAPGTLHQETLGKLFLQLGAYFQDKDCRAFLAPYDVRLPKGKEEDGKIDTVVQPDLMVVCDPGKIDPRGCRGAPDLVMEILSPSSLGQDKLRKLNLYERHGVREYWIVEPEGFVQVFVLAGRKRFLRPEVFDRTMGVPSKIFPGLIIDLTKIFPPEPKVVREPPAHYTPL